jgi:hypothetical protein
MGRFACRGSIMQRLLLSAAIVLCASASAQTTINITMPGTQGSCTYTTGAVLSNSVPGQLQATATSATGTGCGSSGGAVSFGPASPLLPAANTLGNAGGVVNLSFQAVNATSCTGTITGASGGIFTGLGTTKTFCSSAAACASAQSVSTTFPANADTINDKLNSVSATCSAASGSPVTSIAAVTVSHGTVVGSGCPVVIPSSIPGQTFTQWTGNQTVFYFGQGAESGNQSVNVTSFDSFWFAPWPGVNGKSLVATLPTNKYMSMQFTVPAGYFERTGILPTTYGKYYNQNTPPVAAVSMTISTSCGDFSPSTLGGSSVVTGCYLNLASPQTAMFWHTPSGPTCKLQDGATYFLNFINASILNVTPIGGTATPVGGCAAGGCGNPLVNSGSFP